jgi:hypothetical protein
LQLALFQHKHPSKNVKDAAQNLRSMIPEVRAEYNEVEQLVRLLLVNPAASAEAERSFSALRRLKTWLRSTMTQDRLNALCVCCIHKEKLDAIDTEPLLKEFCSKNGYREGLFGKYYTVRPK